MKRENPLKCQKNFMMLFIVFTKKIMTKISFLLQHLATIRSMPRFDRSIDRNPSNRQGELFCFDLIIIIFPLQFVARRHFGHSTTVQTTDSSRTTPKTWRSCQFYGFIFSFTDPRQFIPLRHHHSIGLLLGGIKTPPYKTPSSYTVSFNTIWWNFVSKMPLSILCYDFLKMLHIQTPMGYINDRWN